MSIAAYALDLVSQFRCVAAFVATQKIEAGLMSEALRLYLTGYPDEPQGRQDGCRAGASRRCGSWLSVQQRHLALDLQVQR
jgi:hypothetical protein